ncbi:hypothetical protein F4776DRAFT_229633 [Hypoxylon sp. NC0597]|nr:hypothetical protein F4776DRAFT_229633 [Hypoxylon sp. NC0597]
MQLVDRCLPTCITASVRRVDRDTVISGKLMREGKSIMIPIVSYISTQLSIGLIAIAFALTDLGRLIKGAVLPSALRGPNWRPFGDRKTLCTGRQAAKRETVIFVNHVRRNGCSVGAWVVLSAKRRY